MPASNRENRIIDAVPCPRCHARVGQYCWWRGEPGINDNGRPKVHSERRLAWQEWRREKEKDLWQK